MRTGEAAFLGFSPSDILVDRTRVSALPICPISQRTFNWLNFLALTFVLQVQMKNSVPLILTFTIFYSKVKIFLYRLFRSERRHFVDPDVGCRTQVLHTLQDVPAQSLHGFCLPNPTYSFNINLAVVSLTTL